jgi:(E)-4-hydroxy-3-methylbut-2-enyl-diphosphate synthase
MQFPQRRKTRAVSIGGTIIGGGNPVVIQSMTTTDTADIEATAAQIQRLERAGCEIVRLAVPSGEAAAALGEIKRRVSIPIVADVHFDYRLALLSMLNGADKLRVNPGNIGGRARLKEIADMAGELRVPIRVGVNAGSLEREILDKYGGVTAEALAESCLNSVKMLEEANFSDIVVSVKASNVPLAVHAYELIAERTDYPVHAGITESGLKYEGTIKSAVGIGAVLSRGIGDTIRVSITDDPEEEVKAARAILSALGLRSFGPEIISCPTCGRTSVDLVCLAKDVKKMTKGMNKPIKIAVMGCAVNGPGEAREADVGVAGGNGRGVIFKKGEVVETVAESEILGALKRQIASL